MKHRQAYRPDVDGLRCIAVVSVVLSHVDLPLMSGGFVGADVFFVISGFRINRILVRDLELGSLSIVRFYERQVWRILPAPVRRRTGDHARRSMTGCSPLLRGCDDNAGCHPRGSLGARREGMPIAGENKAPARLAHVRHPLPSGNVQDNFQIFEMAFRETAAIRATGR